MTHPLFGFADAIPGEGGQDRRQDEGEAKEADGPRALEKDDAELGSENHGAGVEADNVEDDQNGESEVEETDGDRVFGLEKTATGLQEEQDNSDESDDEAEQVHFWVRRRDNEDVAICQIVAESGGTLQGGRNLRGYFGKN